MKTLKELCLSSGGAENFSPERLNGIEEVLIEDHRTAMPWYLRFIIGFGAWLASGFFLGAALTLMDWSEKNQTAIGCLGTVLLVVAVFVGRQKWGIFADQCSLAVSFAAQAMMYIGFVNEHFHPLATATIFSILFAAGLYVVFPNFLSRLAACLVALQATLLWIYTSDGELFSGNLRLESELSPLIFFYWVLHLAGICWCFMGTRRPVLFAALGYALVASLVAWQVEGIYHVWVRSTVITYSPAWIEWIVFHARTGLTTLTLFGVSTWAAGGIPALREKPQLFGGLALVLAALVVIGSGGILLALLLLLLGFSLQDRPILGLGLILLPVFLVHYYYYLQLDLLAKAGVLVGSGVLLLVLRTALTRWVFGEIKETT